MFTFSSSSRCTSFYYSTKIGYLIRFDDARRRARLINILDQHCSIENEKIAPGGVRSQYDFLYLVVDFR